MEKIYIFRYDHKDGKFIGYHYDTFCTVGNSCINAKRYPLLEEELARQLTTIQNNYNYMCDGYTQGLFEGYPKEDVILSYEELAPSIDKTHPIVGYKYSEVTVDADTNEIVYKSIND